MGLGWMGVSKPEPKLSPTWQDLGSIWNHAIFGKFNETLTLTLEVGGSALQIEE